LVQNLPRFEDPNLLIGAEHFSDAGVYRLDERTAVIQSVDFFPPLVDDPFLYGQIAAANAMGDIFAMGAVPRTALNIVGFPDDKLALQILQEILRGGAERVRAAGAVIVGGHSVRDTEIKYGLAVTGVVDPQEILTNRHAAPGHLLVLTKGLGTGFITTAHRAGKCPPETLDGACASMIQLNDTAAAAARRSGASAATDVTGFGLAGHALEMARASGVTMTLDLDQLPLLPGAADLAGRRHFTRANETNRRHVLPDARMEADESSPRLEFLYDPQTSGGLLVAVPADTAESMVSACHEAGLSPTAIIGEVRELEDVSLVIRP
jgi:selenide,water dikinase